MDLFGDFSPFNVDGTTESTGFPDIYKYSPAVPTLYDAPMSRSDSSSTNMGTVSPQDLMVRDPSFSAPNSAAFTNLTSPSMYDESPEYLGGYDVSPLYNGAELDPNTADPWFPLFPDANTSQTVESSAADQSPLQPEEQLEVIEQLRNQRRRSGTSPPNNRPSSVSGVGARKRNQPLPPIIVEDEHDTVALKRARNTLAARKSRQKKMERFDELEARIKELEEERDHWKERALARTAAQS
jgi:general control protein GCN4